MDIRNLRTFIRVAELNNFTKAAQSLGYSQSAVTVQMQQLETELGLPLFDRIGKNIKLNQYGLNFIDYAIKVIEAIEKAESFSTEAENMKGYIRFGIVDSILNACFISILPEFNRRFPNIDVSISVGSARDIEAKIRPTSWISPTCSITRCPARSGCACAKRSSPSSSWPTPKTGWRARKRSPLRSSSASA